MLNKITVVITSLFNRVDLTNRMIVIAQRANRLIQQIIYSEKKAQLAAAAGLLSAATTLVVAPVISPNFFVAYSLPPLVGTGCAYLAAAIFPINRGNKERLQKPVKINCTQLFLFSLHNGKIFLIKSGKDANTLSYSSEYLLSQKELKN